MLTRRFRLLVKNLVFGTMAIKEIDKEDGYLMKLSIVKINGLIHMLTLLGLDLKTQQTTIYKYE